MIAAIILWVCAVIYVVLFAVLMITSNTARAFVCGSIKSIVTRRDHLAASLIPTPTKQETTGAEDKGVAKNTTIGLDSALAELEKVYHQIGDKAISHSPTDYERRYLANRKEWASIKIQYPNQDEAIWEGLMSCFTYNPPPMKGTIKSVPINPFLIEAESSNDELRKLRSDINNYLIQFRDKQLFDSIDEFVLALQQRETFRIMYELALRFPILSKRAERQLDLWQMTEKALVVTRAVIRKRLHNLTKPWWIRWIYA